MLLKKGYAVKELSNSLQYPCVHVISKTAQFGLLNTILNIIHKYQEQDWAEHRPLRDSTFDESGV